MFGDISDLLAVEVFSWYTTIQLFRLFRKEMKMTLSHPLPDDLVDLIARRFRAVGEPMRIRLLDQLRDGEATVGELSDALGA